MGPRGPSTLTALDSRAGSLEEAILKQGNGLRLLSMIDRARPLLPVLTGFILSLSWVCALVWPLPLHLSEWHALSAFGDSHIWVFAQQSEALAAGSLSETSCEAGYPFPRHMRSIAWVPGLLFLPLQAILGAIASTHLLQLLSLPLSGVLAGIWIRRVTGCSAWSSHAMGVAYALCPTHLAHLATGEISNTQAWIIPAWLLAMQGPGGGRLGTWRVILFTALVSLAAAFTSPYLALALPLMAGAWLLPRIIGHPVSEWIYRCRDRVAGTLGTALGLIPAWLYYQQDRAGGGESIFQPARRALLETGPLPHPAPIASPESLLWSSGGSAGSPFEPVHSTYLGVVLLGFAIWSLFRTRGSARSAGLALLCGGALLAMGPALAMGGEVRALGTQPLPMPAYLLEALNYPTRIGGLYYRYAVLAVLGAALLSAAGLATLKHGARWSWALLFLQLLDATRGTPSEWPRVTEAIPGRAALLELAGDDGAVLELPLQGPTDAWFGQGALLRATLHQRPTTALPRGIWDPRGGVHGLWSEVMEAPDAITARAMLSDAGFRLVLLPTELLPHAGESLETLEAQLGSAQQEDGLLVWDLGPSTSAPTCARAQ
jgi:hypothetical protein